MSLPETAEGVTNRIVASRSLPETAEGATNRIVAEQRYLHTMFLKRILYYLNPATLFGKSGKDVNLRFMHGINRVSIFMFLICLVVLLLRACLR